MQFFLSKWTNLCIKKHTDNAKNNICSNWLSGITGPWTKFLKCLSHTRNVCKSQNTLLPVFLIFWPCSMIISLHVNHLAPIRTITDQKNSSVCPPQKYSVYDYFATYRHIFYFVTYRHILYSILWLTDTFRKLEIWCNCQILVSY